MLCLSVDTLIPLAVRLRARLCVQQQNLCTRHTTGTKCEEKKKKGWCLILLAKSTSEKRKTQRKWKKEGKTKKKEKSKRVVQTPSPSWKKDAFHGNFSYIRSIRVCLLCLREREREGESDQSNTRR